MRFRSILVFVIALLATLFAATCCCIAQQSSNSQSTGPFGLRRGMTKSQVISIIGHDAVKKETTNALGGSSLTVTSVPKPFREFEEYQLFFSNTDGLLKIIAIGKDIPTSEEGAELREHYSDLKQLLSNTYSTPQEIDFVKSDNSALAEPGNFMLSMLEKERDLSCFWSSQKVKLKDDIGGIVLEAKATRLDTGTLRAHIVRRLGRLRGQIKCR